MRADGAGACGMHGLVLHHPPTGGTRARSQEDEGGMYLALVPYAKVSAPKPALIQAIRTALRASPRLHLVMRAWTCR